MGTAEHPDYLSQPNATDLDHIPGDYGRIPFLGKTMPLLDNPYPLFRDHFEKYGEISRFLIGGRKGLLVLGADNWQQVYLNKDNNFSTQMGYEQSLGRYYRGGLLLRDGDDHRFQRRMFQTAFKTPAMKEYIHTMNPMLKAHMDSWQDQSDFRFFPAIKMTLLEVGAKVFFGEEREYELRRLYKSFADVAEGLLGLFEVELPGFKHNGGAKGERYFREYFGKLIPERRQGEGTDMMSYMVKEKTEDGEYFSNDDLIPQASFLLFAAHDTTTSLLLHVLYRTAMHPEWQDKLREQTLSINKPVLDYDDLEKMELLDLVIKESLRMNPSVAMMSRRTINECELGGYRIPANTLLYLPPIFNHMDERYWTNPTRFDPLRFSAERSEQKNHSFCWTGFGGGAHKCIGMHFAIMNAKTFMHQFLLKYRYSLPENYNPKMDTYPLPKPRDGLPLQMIAIS